MVVHVSGTEDENCWLLGHGDKPSLQLSAQTESSGLALSRLGEALLDSFCGPGVLGRGASSKMLNESGVKGSGD